MTIWIRAFLTKTGMTDFEDWLIALAFSGLVAGLAMVYLPLALILPGAGFLGWAAWRRWAASKR